jgi:hypothetical protein
MNKVLSTYVAQAEVVPIQDCIIPPKLAEVAEQLVRIMNRTTPVFAIRRAPYTTSWGNHNLHRKLVEEALREIGHANSGLGSGNVTQAPAVMHTDSHLSYKARTLLSVHTSAIDTEVIFTATTGINRADNDYRQAHRLFDEGLYDPMFTEGRFYKGVLQADQTVVFRSEDAFPTVHHFRNVDGVQRQYHLTQLSVAR